MKKNNVIKMLMCLVAIQLLGGIAVEGMRSREGMPVSAPMRDGKERERCCCQQCAETVGVACSCCCVCVKESCEMAGLVCAYCLLATGERALRLIVGDCDSDPAQADREHR